MLIIEDKVPTKERVIVLCGYLVFITVVALYGEKLFFQLLILADDLSKAL